MNDPVFHQPSNVRIYWRAWLGLVTLALLLRFTVFLGASHQRLFSLATAYVLSTWLPIMALNFVEGRRLTS